MKSLSKNYLLSCLQNRLIILCDLLKCKESSTDEAISFTRGECSLINDLLIEYYQYDLLHDFDNFIADVYRSLVVYY